MCSSQIWPLELKSSCQKLSPIFWAELICCGDKCNSSVIHKTGILGHLWSIYGHSQSAPDAKF